jgi:hypothetical protein
MKSGNLNFLEPSGSLQACNGTALPLYFYNLCSIDIVCNMTLSSIFKYLLHTSSLQSFSFICYQIYSTLSQAMLPVLFPVIQSDILWDLQCVRTSCASPLSKSFNLVCLQIYGTFSRAMLRIIPSLRGYAEPLTNAMVEFYLSSQERFTQDMQPHYVYSPREMTRWVRGICEAIR